MVRLVGSLGGRHGGSSTLRALRRSGRRRRRLRCILGGCGSRRFLFALSFAPRPCAGDREHRGESAADPSHGVET